MKSLPMLQVRVHDTPLTIMVNYGASVTKPPTPQQTKVKIYAHKSSESLTVLGKFTSVLKFKSTCVKDKIYVVKRSGGWLLCWKTSHKLGLLKAVHQAHDSRSTRVEELVKEYDELFHGFGKLKGSR